MRCGLVYFALVPKLDQLLARGWTKERLLDVAEGYEHVARITPNNPSAAGRGAQLRDIAKLFD